MAYSPPEQEEASPYWAERQRCTVLSERKFYHRVYQVEVLSEEELSPEMELDDIHHAITDGDCSGVVSITKDERFDARKMAQLLMKQGSDPGFFQLTEDGEDADDI